MKRSTIASGVQNTFLSAPIAAVANSDGLNGGWQAAVFVLVLLGLLSRCPSLITHAQFYAEDGSIWFAQAYSAGGLRALLLPQAGYLNFGPRLAAALAVWLPLRWAPLVMVSAGLLAQALPVPILLSSRCRAWASLPIRAGLSALYIALPVKEIHVYATNMQWHLALAAVLVALSAPPQSWRGRLFDSLVIAAAALSGPFCLVLAPLMLAFWWLKRQTWTLAVFALNLAGAMTQYAFLLRGPVRAGAVLGATWPRLLRIVGGNVVSFAIVGGSSFPWRAPMVAIVLATLLGLAVYLYCLRFANTEWRLFLFFCIGVFAASLRSPLTDGTGPAWQSLVMAVAARYWFFPALAFGWGVLWCARYSRARIIRIGAVVILGCMSIGIVRDWRYQPFPDENYAGSVERMMQANPGQRVVIPIVPAGWTMELVKK